MSAPNPDDFITLDRHEMEKALDACETAILRAVSPEMLRVFKPGMDAVLGSLRRLAEEMPTGVLISVEEFERGGVPVNEGVSE